MCIVPYKTTTQRHKNDRYLQQGPGKTVDNGLATLINNEYTSHPQHWENGGRLQSDSSFADEQPSKQYYQQDPQHWIVGPSKRENRHHQQG